jgi:hypothetical protein
MGGSGGGSYFGGGDPEKAKQHLQTAKEETQTAEYIAACNAYLKELLTRFNDRDVAGINKHLHDIEEALGKELEGAIELVFGGSVAKHTYVDGLSDVDSLVMLDNCSLADQPPGIAKQYLADRIRERFPGVKVDVGKLAVTVHFPDADIQLLPAVSCQNHVKIGDSSGQQWSAIKPQEFTRALSSRNDAVGKKLVPTIKLAKAIIAGLPEQQQISGYHAESLAIEAFKNYSGPFTHRDMLKHYFGRGAQLLLEPIRDRTGQSVHVDDALGGAASLERKIVSDAFTRVSRRMANADRAGRAEDWSQLFSGV